MALSVQYATKQIPPNRKLNEKSSNKETDHYDVMCFSHKQLSSKHMNSIPVSLFPIYIFIEMAKKGLGTHIVSLD